MLLVTPTSGNDEDETRFLGLGDWGVGLDAKTEERQWMEGVAAAMSTYAASWNPNFVLALGDNFYQVSGPKSIEFETFFFSRTV